MSELLFGSKNAYRSFLRINLPPGKKLDPKLGLAQVNRILISVLKWTTDKFTSQGINMDADKLKNIKKKVKLEIDKWVFENCYDPAYIGGVAFHKIAQDSKYKADYDFVQLLWLAVSIYEDNPTISFDDIKKSKVLGVGISLIDRILIKEGSLSPKSLKRIITTLLRFYNERHGRPRSTAEVTIYALAAMEAVKYAVKRNYRLSHMLKPVWFDTSLWNEEYIEGYHVVMGIGRHLGIDPITFEALDDNIFSKIKNKILNFARHHKDRSKPDSLLIWDHVLTNSKNHKKFWARLNKAQANQVITAYETLITMKGSGSNNAITKLDIENKFKNTGWLYDEVIAKNWFNNPNFNFEKDLLPEFNERREDMKNLGLKGFMADLKLGRYKIAYERFYENVIKDNPLELYSILHGYHQIDDIYKVMQQVQQTLDVSLYGKFSFGTAYATLLSIDGRVVQW